MIAAFDGIATSYDSTFTQVAAGRWQREAVWRRIDQRFGPGDRVLELGCGTGEDALHLVARGVTVVAIDASPTMVEVAGRKLAGPIGNGQAELRALGAERLDALPTSAAGFDGVLANFSVLDCIAPLGPLGSELARRTRPGAKMMAVIFGRTCAWEWLARGVGARRRWRRTAPAQLAGGAPFTVHYRSPRSLADQLGWQLVAKTGIGLLVPPAGVGPSSSATIALLARLERPLLAPLWFLADHLLVELERP